MEESYTSFCCSKCGTELQASPDMIGLQTECPACGTQLVIPDNRSDGITRYGSSENDKSRTQALKSRTIRIELGDDL